MKPGSGQLCRSASAVPAGQVHPVRRFLQVKIIRSLHVESVGGDLGA